MMPRRAAVGSEGTGGAGQPLLDFLRQQRWFGEKGRDLRGARIVDRIPVRWPESEGDFVVARVRVDLGDGDPVMYQLFLRADGSVDDALADEAFRRGLIAAFAAGSTCERDGLRWSIQSESEASFQAPADAAVTLARKEQSNSSVFVGEQAVLKLFRKIAPGVHPDIEVTRFLTVERRFLHTPALLGSIHFADERGTWAAGMLQEFVPGATDAWSHALECAADWFADKVPEDRVPFVGEAARLGEITRAMHDTLASGDPGSPFEATPATAADVTAWADATVMMARQSLRSSGRSEDMARAERRVRAIAAAVGADAGSKIRIHGDYHLGQVLRSQTNAFLVVDFEGEPARPLEERRQPHSPLRDVAGMLRSFAYAAATLSRDDEGRRIAWESATRDAFLRGYLRADGPKAILPGSRAGIDNLLRLFEAEKAFYELQYEIDHRPDWAWIPLAAIDRMHE